MPSAILVSPEYQALTEDLQRELLAHVHFMEEVPKRMEQWIDEGAASDQLRALILGLDLDISIQIGIPDQSQMEISAHALRQIWLDDRKPLVELLRPQHVDILNMKLPSVGSSLSEAREWIKEVSIGLSALFDGFFGSSTFETGLAYLVSIHVLLSGTKFGLGRIDLSPPV